MEIFPPQKIKIAEVSGKGLGVVAVQNIAKGEVIEVCPIIFLSEKDTHYTKKESDLLKFYYLEQALSGKHCLMLGYGSLYNHSANPNADMDYDPEGGERKVIFEALKDISAGEEIMYNYDDYDNEIEFLDLK